MLLITNYQSRDTMIEKIDVSDITAFGELHAEFAPGLNVFIGENSTGKTHLMKLLYSALIYSDAAEQRNMKMLLMENFLPDTIGRMVKRAQGRKSGSFEILRCDEDKDPRSLKVRLTTQQRVTEESEGWRVSTPMPSVFIPVKDMLANAPGFLSLYRDHTIHFEGVYADIISKALYPATRGRRGALQKELLDYIEKEIGGTIAVEKEEFYLKSRDGSGNLEFTLLSEGYRKLGLLFCLIQNERLAGGSILFWDEPETNLNPKMMGLLVDILYKLVEMGVQIFISTHNSMLTSQIRLREEKGPTRYHLFRRVEGEVLHSAHDHLSDMEDNPIRQAYDDLLIQQIESDLNEGNY